MVLRERMRVLMVARTWLQLMGWRLKVVCLGQAASPQDTIVPLTTAPQCPGQGHTLHIFFGGNK